MDKEVMTVFLKNVGIGLVKLASYVGAIVALTYAYVYFGVDGADAVLASSMTALIVLFTWFGLDTAYTNAKRKVEFKRTYGEDL